MTRYRDGGRVRLSSAVLVPALAAFGVAATLLVPSAAADGPGGYVEGGDISRAVGSGVLNGILVGFTASGADNDAASASVVAMCQTAGAEQCSSDEVTNDVFCVVTVGDDGSGVVAGGAGLSVEAARDDAHVNAGRAGVAFGPTARVLASSCP